VPVRVECIPVHSREDGVLTELASVDLNRRPLPGACREAIGRDRRGEVISHGVAVRQVDRLASSDRDERPKTEVRHPFRVAFRVATAYSSKNESTGADMRGLWQP